VKFSEVRYLHRGEALGDQVVEGVEVALALGHLVAVDEQVRAVEPMRGETLHAGRALGLRDLVLVVREAEVDAAAVQVEGGAEMLQGHRGALDVPARTTFAPRAGPVVVAVLGLVGFPQGEVGGGLAVVLVGVVGLAGAVGRLRTGLAAVQAGELAVIGAGADLEVDGAVLGDVGVAAVDERPDHGDLLRDVLDRAGLDLRDEQPEGRAIGVELVGPALGESRQGHLRRHRPADRLVVHVGEVADMLHLEAVDLERATEDVLQEEGPEVADVGRAVHGRTAAIHAEGGAAGLEEQGAHLAAHGVVQEDGHTVRPDRKEARPRARRKRHRPENGL
jgi:hypothetical protein